MFKTHFTDNSITPNLMHLDNFMLLHATKLSAIILLGLLFLPFLPFLLIFIFFSLFIIVPIICIFIAAYILYLVISRLHVRAFVKILLSFSVWVLDSSSNTVFGCFDCKFIQNVEEKPVSVVLDPSEVPSLEESEEEEEDGRDKEEQCKIKKEIHRINAKSWNLQSFRTSKCFDDNSFYEILSFWKTKESTEV